MPVDLARVEEIFADALNKAVSAERAAYLDQACGDDAELRRRVEQLLAAHDATGNFLKLPESNGDTSPYVPVTEGPKSKIGRYKLLEQIGEGGFGVVFMAEQEEPVRRLVALKIIKLGMDTRQVVARFEAERQALAMMDHPSVAKVFDGGATETGRPYFVMELVKGVPITEYCDRQQLSIPQRLELFSQVCSAVQHAHQKGLIHRDIKPTNVLVSSQDDRPVAKVIDFGVAKAMQARLTEKTLFTEFQQLVGTPAYMSPEQAVGSLDIDTRSDVYSLGVLLYELLTGTTPFDPKELRSKAFAELQRIIREVDPPTPSTRLSSLRTTSDSLPLAGRVGEGVPSSLASIAANRQTESARLSKEVRGELDWIVMRALEKDRTRRYQTASALVDDIQRYLTDQPIEASPPSSAYRLKKFIRRNKTGVLAGTAIAVALVAGLILASTGFVQARRQSDIAHAEAVCADREASNARTEAARSEQVARFLKDMLAGVGPSVALGRDTTMLREIADKTAARLDEDLANQQQVEADLRTTISRVYVDLGENAKAEIMAREALAIKQQLFGIEHPQVATALTLHASTLDSSNKWDEAEVVAREGLAMTRRTLGNDHLEVANSIGVLAHTLRSLPQKRAEAEPLLREALVIQRIQLGKENPQVAATLGNLAYVLTQVGKLDEAEEQAREAVAIHRKHFGSDHPSMADSLGDLSSLLKSSGKLSEAVSVRESLLLRRKYFGNEHPKVAWSLVFLSRLLSQQDKLEEAEEAAREALAIRRKTLRSSDPTLSNSFQELANILKRRGKVAEARVLYQNWLTMLFKAAEAEPNDAQTLSTVAWVLATAPYESLRNTDRAVEMAKKAVELAPQDGNIWNTFGVAEYRDGNWKAAVEGLSKAIEHRNGGDAFDWYFLAMAHWQLGQKELARMWYDKAVESNDAKDPANGELFRFRAEAAALLGVEEPQSKDNPEPHRTNQQQQRRQQRMAPDG